MVYSGNYKDLDKMRMKLFPNFTCHHLITHTNKVLFLFMIMPISRQTSNIEWSASIKQPLAVCI